MAVYKVETTFIKIVILHSAVQIYTTPPRSIIPWIPFEAGQRFLGTRKIYEARYTICQRRYPFYIVSYYIK